MIVSITMMILAIAMLFIAYAMNVLALWEMILMALFTMPIYLYYKKNNRVWRCYFLTVSIGVVFRYLSNGVVLKYARTVNLPFNINDDVVLQLIGISTILTWSLWFLFVGVFTYLQANNRLSKIEDINTLNKDHVITRAINMFTVTTVVLIANLCISLFAYKLKEVAMNILISVFITVIVALAYMAGIADATRRRREELYEKSLASENERKFVNIDLKEATNKSHGE